MNRLPRIPEGTVRGGRFRVNESEAKGIDRLPEPEGMSPAGSKGFTSPSATPDPAKSWGGAGVSDAFQVAAASPADGPGDCPGKGSISVAADWLVDAFSSEGSANRGISTPPKRPSPTGGVPPKALSAEEGAGAGDDPAGISRCGPAAPPNRSSPAWSAVPKMLSCS